MGRSRIYSSIATFPNFGKYAFIYYKHFSPPATLLFRGPLGLRPCPDTVSRLVCFLRCSQDFRRDRFLLRNRPVVHFETRDNALEVIAGCRRAVVSLYLFPLHPETRTKKMRTCVRLRSQVTRQRSLMRSRVAFRLRCCSPLMQSSLA